VYTHPNFLVLWAAGNGSPFPGSVFEDGSAKNLITVGNVYKGAGADDLNVSSCRGPALDGRIKPELLAPGSDVWSANGCPGGCSDYVTKSGTSMATPAVAASAALIRQYFTEGWYPTGTKGTGTFVTPSAALLKAMLINSAREIDGAEAYANGENFYPNNQQGWGRIVTDDALFFKGDARKLFMAQGSTGGTGTSVSYSLKVTNSSQPLNVTLVWTDYPSIPNTGTSPTLVNDLDLVVRAPDGTTVYKGNQFNTQHPGESLPNAIGADARNPVETVLVRTGVLGCFSGYASGYTIEVHARRVGAPQCSPPGCSDPPDAQPFALVVTGGLEPDLDADGTRDCTDTDADGDGELNGTDCLPFDARAKHGLIEGPVTVGGTATACQDGLDNDCDGVVDYDCAINIDAANGQWIGPGTVQSGTVADLAAASADDTYEVLRETAVNKSLVSVWTFTVPNNAATYDAVVESFRSGIDYHTYHYLKKTSTTQCNNNLSGWLPLFNVTATADSDQPLRASIGSLTAGTVCIRSSDVGPQNDQTADTQTLDRVFLFPRPACTDADGDGYTSSCTGCVLATCPLLDCDDSDGGLNPGVSTNPFNSERLATCADGDDNDCDGAIDGADAGCQAPPPDVLTSSEAGTPAIDETSALQTYVADNVREVIQEVADSLNHTWTFANVPVGFSHTLKVKAKRRNGGGTENFTVHFSKDGVNFGSSLATITQLEANSALPLPEPVSGTVYVQIRDVGSGSTADQFLEVDFLAIGTTP
jgi:hypothetical protein